MLDGSVLVQYVVKIVIEGRRSISGVMAEAL